MPRKADAVRFLEGLDGTIDLRDALDAARTGLPSLRRVVEGGAHRWRFPDRSEVLITHVEHGHIHVEFSLPSDTFIADL